VLAGLSRVAIETPFAADRAWGSKGTRATRILHGSGIAPKIDLAQPLRLRAP